MSTAEMRVVEISRRESDNGYVYEYDESLASVKAIQRTHAQRINWWRANADAEPGAEAA